MQGTRAAVASSRFMTRARDDFNRSGHVNTPSPFAITLARRLVSIEPPPAVIVDLGCGNGRDSYYFASKGLGVIAIDRSAVGIAAAQSLAPRPSSAADVHFLKADLQRPHRGRRWPQPATAYPIGACTTDGSCSTQCRRAGVTRFSHTSRRRCSLPTWLCSSSAPRSMPPCDRRRLRIHRASGGRRGAGGCRTSGPDGVLAPATLDPSLRSRVSQASMNSWMLRTIPAMPRTTPSKRFRYRFYEPSRRSVKACGRMQMLTARIG